MNSGKYLNVWLLAVRPKTLGAALAPIMIGTTVVFTEGKGHAGAALAALLGALLIQTERKIFQPFDSVFESPDIVLDFSGIRRSMFFIPSRLQHE